MLYRGQKLYETKNNFESGKYFFGLILHFCFSISALVALDFKFLFAFNFMFDQQINKSCDGLLNNHLLIMVLETFRLH